MIVIGHDSIGTNINRKDAQIIANCPYAEARRKLMSKYIDEMSRYELETNYINYQDLIEELRKLSKKLGKDGVYHYHSADLVDQISDAIKEREVENLKHVQECLLAVGKLLNIIVERN